MRLDCTEPPWTQLDPGIVDAVRALWDVGLYPTDSGDGVSKPYEHEGILRIPHVFCSTSVSTMFDDAKLALRVLQSMDKGWVVEVLYSPVDERLVLMATRPSP